MRNSKWQVEWVEDMPQSMRSGTLYISIKHRLIEHVCACGCGEEISLPLGKSEWRIAYDGDSISVFPSVGNWRLPCKSHYVIRENKTIWCTRWTEKQILEGRKRDRAEKLADIRRKNWRESWLGRLLALIGFDR